jgi:hypothetical protein
VDAKLVIAAGAVYAGVYYFLARRLLLDLKGVDREYFEYLRARGGTGIGTSSAVLSMIFDSGTPKEFWPAGVRFRLTVVRVMLALSPLLFIGMFVLL